MSKQGQEEESGFCFARSFLLEDAPCGNSKKGSNDGNRTMRAMTIIEGQVGR